MTTTQIMQTGTKPLLAFHGDPKIKVKYLKRIRAHAKADELIRGTGWNKYTHKGCAVGCTLNAYEHAAYETELGIPEILAYLEDNIFENLSKESSHTWPERFLKAIPVGADLSKAAARILIWQYSDSRDGLVHTEEVKSNIQLRKVCEDLVALYQRTIDGGSVTVAEWQAIENRAWAEAWVRVGAWAWVAWRWAWAWAKAGAWTWAGTRITDDYDALSLAMLKILSECPVLDPK